MNPSVIREARLADAPALGAIGPAAYVESYSDLWESPSALAEHLISFGETAWRECLNDAQTRVWIAEDEAAPVGFLTLKFDSPDPVTRAPGGVEVPRIYILRAALGRRFGEQLFQAALAAAQEADAPYIWLDVMASAPWAARSYKRWGFSEIGRDRFPKAVKPGMAEMIVLRKDL